MAMQLLESKREKKGRSAGGTIFSIILHSLIIFLAIFATARAGSRKKDNTETKVNFVRPITLETGRLRCDGTIVHRGGTVATAEGRLVAEGTGKLLAHGTSTCLVFKR